MTKKKESSEQRYGWCDSNMHQGGARLFSSLFHQVQWRYKQILDVRVVQSTRHPRAYVQQACLHEIMVFSLDV